MTNDPISRDLPERDVCNPVERPPSSVVGGLFSRGRLRKQLGLGLDVFLSILYDCNTVYTMYSLLSGLDMLHRSVITPGE